MTETESAGKNNIKHSEEDYIVTASGNFVARGATLQGAQRVELKGRSVVSAGVVLRGDLAAIRVGRYTFIDTGTVITPPAVLPFASAQQQAAYAPVSVGAHTTLGAQCDIQAAAIGSYNLIGDGVVLGPRVILKDAVVVADDTHIPADTVIPPFTRVSNNHNNSHQLALIPLSPATIPVLQESALDAYHERVRFLTGA